MNDRERSGHVNAPERLMCRVGFVMHKAGQRGMIVFNAALSGLGMDVRQYGVLSVLMEGPCSQVVLSEALRVDRTSVVELIDQLEANGLVKRTVNPSDRRAHIVKITGRGRKAVLTGDQHALEADLEFTAPLNSLEREALLSLMRKLV